jgi:hypothetical protein
LSENYRCKGDKSMNKPFLDSYEGQSTTELIALKDTYRIDSLVLAFEQAIQAKPEADLTEPERFVLAIEAMEREVNNGGWNQFFLNTNNEFNPILVNALIAIDCPDNSEIASKAISAFQGETEMEALEELDNQYFAGTESIADKLFQYIERHPDEI